MSLITNMLMNSRNILRIQRAIPLIRRESDFSKLNAANHRVNNLEKKFLVWTGKYKTVEEVPAFVQQNVVERARNRMRIRIANYMMAATALSCFIMIMLGKRAAERGESVVKQNQEWHRQFNEESKKADA